MTNLWLAAMSEPIRFFFRLMHVLSNTGRFGVPRRLMPLLEKVAENLNEADQTIFRDHIDNVFFTEISNPRMCVFRYTAKYVHSQFPAAKYGGLLKIFVDNAKKSTIQLTFYQGRLFSLEFKDRWWVAIPPEIGSVRIKRGAERESFAYEIDREEHGDAP